MKDSLVLTKTRAFSVRIVRLCRYLREEKREYILSKQLLRSGTSIGANVHEGKYGQSTDDFISKHSIALKEAAETEYWLRLLVLSDFLTEAEGESLLNDCLEIKRILVSSLNTAKEKK